MDSACVAIVLRMLRCSRLRRLTAFAAQLLLLQLALTSGAGVCPLGGDANTADESGMADGPHHADNSTRVEDSSSHGHRASTGSRHGDLPTSHHHSGAHCDMACAPVDCGSAGHCYASARSSEVAPASPRPVRHRAVSGALDGAPHSVSSAPEPPPPRA